jgi:hypothetical protein
MAAWLGSHCWLARGFRVGATGRLSTGVEMMIVARCCTADLELSCGRFIKAAAATTTSIATPAVKAPQAGRPKDRRGVRGS